MARGKPFLLTLDYLSGSTINVRLFRLNSSDVFTSIATSTIPGINFNSNKSGVFFSGDLSLAEHALIIGTRNVANTENVINAVSIPGLSVLATMSNADMHNGGNYFRKTGTFSVSVESGGSNQSAWGLNYYNPDVSGFSVINNIIGSANRDRLGVMTGTSEDDLYILQCRAMNASLGWPLYLGIARNVNEPTGYYAYESNQQQDSRLPPVTSSVMGYDSIKFSYDSRYVFAISYVPDTDNSFVDICSFDVSKLTEFGISTTPPADVVVWRNRISETIGQANAMCVHPSNKFLAVGFITNDGVTATTRIYRFQDNKLTIHDTLSGIGAKLAFTEDGKYLIDAVRRKAYNIVGDTFTENLTMMVNIPAGAKIQGLSRHVDTAVRGELYETGLDLLINNDPTTLDLRLKYLKTNAFFKNSHSTLAQVTNSGAYEVAEGLDIPADGYPLANIAVQTIGDEVIVKADNMRKIGMTQRTSRYAVIYDYTSGVPVSMIRFQDNLNWDMGMAINLPLSDGFVTYSK